ncbi:LysR family transcriptional regulator [Pseudomonas aeruginosa]|uniref:LysR family transcriptional regulator n=7 Tax=Pseudomonas aeruginosa TaxID=287 RepID=UPI000651AFFD|nr:LysR family transcriptional regulator [Pseudomonas aeruginosa]
MKDLDDLAAFAVLHDLGSFTRAAERLGCSKGQLSKRIGVLEQKLGVTLLHRTTRRLSLTAAGAALLPEAQALLVQAERARQAVARLQERAEGRVRVTLPVSLGETLFDALLEDFQERHPLLRVELDLYNGLRDLVGEGFDLAIRSGVEQDARLVARPLFVLQEITCASPAYLEEHGEPRTPADLDRHWAVNYASPSSGRVLPWEYREDGRTLTRALRSRVTVNNAESYIACCLSGLGLIQIPAYDVREHLQRGELREVLPQWRAEAMPAYALYPHRRHLSRRVRAFVDWLEQLLRARL